MRISTRAILLWFEDASHYLPEERYSSDLQRVKAAIHKRVGYPIVIDVVGEETIETPSGHWVFRWCFRWVFLPRSWLSG